jgi:hypothetical protein
MESLNSNWFTEGWVDFEYKKYQLLAYLSKVKKRFDEALLYPQLSELVLHYNNLLHFKTQKTLLLENSKKELRSIDLKNLTLFYEQIIQDDEIMSELETIVAFSIPKFEHSLNEGKELFDFVANNLIMDIVGILPLYKEEGYLFLSVKKTCFVYQYHHGVFQTADNTYKGLNIELVKEESTSISNNYENIKLSLIKEKKDLPNPATYVMESKLQLPLNETLLPVAKRILLKELSKAA